MPETSVLPEGERFAAGERAVSKTASERSDAGKLQMGRETSSERETRENGPGSMVLCFCFFFLTRWSERARQEDFNVVDCARKLCLWESSGQQWVRKRKMISCEQRKLKVGGTKLRSRWQRTLTNKIRKCKIWYNLGNDGESLDSKFWFILSCTRWYVPRLSRGLWKPTALPNIKIMLQRQLDHEELPQSCASCSLLYSRNCGKFLIHINSFTYYQNPMRKCLSLLHRYRKTKAQRDQATFPSHSAGIW